LTVHIGLTPGFASGPPFASRGRARCRPRGIMLTGRETSAPSRTLSLPRTAILDLAVRCEALHRFRDRNSLRAKHYALAKAPRPPPRHRRSEWRADSHSGSDAGRPTVVVPSVGGIDKSVRDNWVGWVPPTLAPGLRRGALVRQRGEDRWRRTVSAELVEIFRGGGGVAASPALRPTCTRRAAASPARRRRPCPGPDQSAPRCWRTCRTAVPG
jgi:hypothetical protein